MPAPPPGWKPGDPIDFSAASSATSVTAASTNIKAGTKRKASPPATEKKPNKADPPANKPKISLDLDSDSDSDSADSGSGSDR
jgi:hypothetical protein